jgi:putative hemolysin
MKSLAISIAVLSLCACNTVQVVSKDTYWTTATDETHRVNRATAFCERQGKEYVAVMQSAGQLVFRCVDTPTPADGGSAGAQ